MFWNCLSFSPREFNGDLVEGNNQRLKLQRIQKPYLCHTKGPQSLNLVPMPVFPQDLGKWRWIISVHFCVGICFSSRCVQTRTDKTLAFLLLVCANESNVCDSNESNV